MKFLDGFQEHIYATFRIVSGFLFIWHGSQKFFGFPLDYPYGPLSTMTIGAGVIELLGGTLVMLGLFTRPTAFICSGTMAFAYWMAHGMQNLFPIINGGELAIMFCFGFLLIAARGAGIWSIDK
jgi:putative oxidoreductase